MSKRQPLTHGIKCGLAQRSSPLWIICIQHSVKSLCGFHRACQEQITSLYHSIKTKRPRSPPPPPASFSSSSSLNPLSISPLVLPSPSPSIPPSQPLSQELCQLLPLPTLPHPDSFRNPPLSHSNRRFRLLQQPPRRAASEPASTSLSRGRCPNLLLPQRRRGEAGPSRGPSRSQGRIQGEPVQQRPAQTDRPAE